MRALDVFLRQLTVANQLTLLRLAAVPALVMALLEGKPLIALICFLGAALTDRLDGIAARRLGHPTAIGAFLDPAADKLMMVSTFVVLSLPDHPRPFPDFTLLQHVPAWYTVLVVLRDVLIVIVALSLYLGHQITRFLPTGLGKWNTGFEMGVGGAFLLANVWPPFPSWLLVLGIWVSTALIVASGVQYLLRASRQIRTMGNGGHR